MTHRDFRHCTLLWMSITDADGATDADPDERPDIPDRPYATSRDIRSTLLALFIVGADALLFP